MDDVVNKPSSSEDLIASLISEVQQLKQPFDVTDLLPVRSKKTVGSSKSRTSSLSPKCERKEKKQKEKKLKKSRKWKRTPSKSPPPKKNNKRKDRSRSTSYGGLKEAGFLEMKQGSKSFVEAALERVSDDDEDDDDLPVGADFRTLSSIQSPDGVANVSIKAECEKKPLSPDINKRREFAQTEEFFPLSKPRNKKDRSESPPISKNLRPLPEVLAKVKAEKNASFVPRNVKLKLEGTKSSSNTAQRNGSPITKINQNETENEEYGPVQAPCPSGPLPISDDDDDDNEATFSGRNDLIQPKTIKFGLIGQVIGKKSDEKHEYTKHSGEVPVSEDSTIGKDDLACGEEAILIKKEEDHQELRKESRKMKHDKRRKKERKRRRKERRRQSDEASSSSDSEKEWEKLRKRQKLKYDSMILMHGLLFCRSPRGSSFRYAVGANDFKSFSRRGIISRSGRDKRLLLSREKMWRTDNGKRHMDDKRRYYRRRSMSSSDRRRSRTHSKSRSRSRNRSSGSSRRSSRSRSRSNSSDYSSKGHKIDKKKLLEIAQKNAAQMAQLGYLPNAAPEVTARMKTGMQSVDQLVDFCQKLQRSQEKDEKVAAAAVAVAVASSSGGGSGSKSGFIASGKISNDEDDLLPRKKKLEETTEFVKHPFAIKPTVPITINITNAASLPIKSASTQRPTEDNNLRLSFPVSSGQQQKNSEWVPVTRGSEIGKKNGSYLKGYDSKVGGINGVFLLPPPPKPPVLLPHCNSAPSSLITLPPPPPPPSILLDCSLTPGLSTAEVSERTDQVSTEDESSQAKKPTEDVGKLIAKRLEANRRLRVNPNDLDALKMLKEAEEQASFICT
uniref:Protein SON n=1 Tax=Syphacia muris TaxID=451379 RepID=A0A158R651_9BILA